MNQEWVQSALNLLVLLLELLGVISTIIGWALVVCAFLVCVWILLPYLYRKFWRVRVYYEFQGRRTDFAQLQGGGLLAPMA